MKVFDLSCENEHRFEGWFASAQAYDEQLGRGLIECPVCASRAIRRLPSAPRLNLSDAREPAGKVQPGKDERASDAERLVAAMPTPEQLQALWMKMARHLADTTEDVGERFAEEARRIHYDEAPRRGIRGVATPEQRTELEDEGIEVFSFPLPAVAKEPLQ